MTLARRSNISPRSMQDYQVQGTFNGLGNVAAMRIYATIIGIIQTKLN